MVETRSTKGIGIVWGLLFLLAALLCVREAWPYLSGNQVTPLDRVVFAYSVLPRAAIALVAGASLGLAGLLLQRVLRNPLAEASTLGIAAGAQLALTAATLFSPALLLFSREAVAMAGGFLAAGVVLAATWKRGLEPVSVVLAGMMTALTATAASAALVLANGEYMLSLFIWGGGALDQQSWHSTLTLIVRFGLVAGLGALMLRPLAILGLSDESARSLGLGLNAARLMSLVLAVWLASSVTAEVGVIGFVGLVAPALAALSGARTLRSRFIAAPMIGATLLWLTDGLVQLGSAAGAQRLPTGAVTALLGGPLMLWLLPRLRLFEFPSFAVQSAPLRRARRPARLIVAIAALLAAALLLALTLGRGPEGWHWAGSAFHDLLAWRLPRATSAAPPGAQLPAAGFILQRLTANPLASPEVLGVGTGGGVGLAVVLLVLPSAGFSQQVAATLAGSLLVLAVVLLAARRGGFGPERLLLAGIAVGAICSAVLTAVIASGNLAAFTLLAWLSGSVGQTSPNLAAGACATAVALVAPLFFLRRWLNLLPLGDEAAGAAGLDVGRVRLALIIAVSMLTATATMLVGPLSFIGLIAPHLARAVGLTRAGPGLAAAVLLGALLMLASDWLARMVAFPYQLPVGLFAALLGGPYLVWLLGRGQIRRG